MLTILPTRDEFFQKEIRRTTHTLGDIAEIIFDTCPEGPIRLIGFTAQAELTDYEILELGFDYYQAFINQIRTG